MESPKEYQDANLQPYFYVLKRPQCLTELLTFLSVFLNTSCLLHNLELKIQYAQLNNWIVI
uniref:Uncharacterized protein n=2 Tax=Cercopithecinae TaxID=9528 RepID=A0A2K5L319_CERAT